MSVRIVDVELPEHPDDDSAAAELFRGFVEVRNVVTRELWGGRADLDISLQESFVNARDSSEDRQHRVAAVIGGQVVGFARVEVSLHEATAPAYLILGVLPEHRRRGIGTALFEQAEVALRAEGRAVTHVWVEHPTMPGERLVPSTGFGSIPALLPGAIALQRAGFALEQVERISRLDLSPDARASLKREVDVARAAAPGYRLLTWEGRTPDALLQTMAELGARMSTDVPSGGLESVEEKWDAARLAEFERTEIDALGRKYLTVAAFDGDTAVAFTKLLLPATQTRQAIQQDTLVHADHRGHRLGMLVKATNLLQLMQNHPDYRSVITWNAEENRHMLAVNERLGFSRVMFEGAWQRREARG